MPVYCFRIQGAGAERSVRWRVAQPPEPGGIIAFENGHVLVHSVAPIERAVDRAMAGYDGIVVCSEVAQARTALQAP